ncbi:MAG: AI-2E family transporter [Ferruginibacter sp.]
MENSQFNDRLRQIILLGIIVLILIILLSSLSVFIPGILGAITLYILSRALFFRLTFKKGWNKSLTAFLLIIGSLIIIAIPIYFSVELITPKINALISNQDKIVENLKNFSERIHEKTGITILSAENSQQLSQKLAALIPKLLNSTAVILTNLLMLFFLYYYLLMNGKTVEKYLNKLIPLKKSNVQKLASETKVLIRANALGIPIICVVQGLFATLGYYIFGVEDWALWGFITGVFAYFPLVGTMLIWVPLVLYQFSLGDNWMAIGLAIYSLIVTGNVDYITRLGLMKKMGNIHPLVTVLGVVVGLGLFGFIGLIFGPLLISYFIVLIRIYMNEFTESGKKEGDLDTTPAV